MPRTKQALGAQWGALQLRALGWYCSLRIWKVRLWLRIRENFRRCLLYEWVSADVLQLSCGTKADVWHMALSCVWTDTCAVPHM